jgi:hypothetical protein
MEEHIYLTIIGRREDGGVDETMYAGGHYREGVQAHRVACIP